MSEKKAAGGLAGITAGETAICTVGKEGAGLTYRGYDIYDLSDNATFEEVAYLLIYGRLPNRAELDAYVERLKGMRGLPALVKETLEKIPGTTHPMDVLRTGCSVLGNVEPEGDYAAVRAQLDEWEAAGLLEYETCEARVLGSFDDRPGSEEEE